MARQTTKCKWSAAVVGEATYCEYSSATKAMGYESLKPEEEKAVLGFVNGLAGY